MFNTKQKVSKKGGRKSDTRGNRNVLMEIGGNQEHLTLVGKILTLVGMIFRCKCRKPHSNELSRKRKFKNEAGFRLDSCGTNKSVSPQFVLLTSDFLVGLYCREEGLLLKG